jgi:Ycf66 protein N-terminus.
MLAYILAITVGLASFGLYMAAFFFPEVHRKSDFVWSGVGLFYGLILWACAGRITGAVLLGQVASVSLLVWLGWEVLTLRRTATPVTEQTPIPAKLKQRVNGLIGVRSPVIFS